MVKQLVKKFVVFLVALALTFIVLGFLFAQEAVDLEKVVVTPYRFEDVVAKTPQAITVITESQIKSSNARTVPGLLQTQPGVAVRDWYGNGTKVAVDLGGFGEQAPLNTLVLIDGRRVNEIDISGVDWTQIPLQNIEKVEILRGGGGSVLYGDNAAGGVINIITKQGRGLPQWTAEACIGSYQADSENLSLGGAAGKSTYYFSASRNSTNGYRQNSYFQANDFNTKLTHALNDDFGLRMSAGYHQSIFGLPGELSDTDLLTMSRRSSKYGDDHAKAKDYFVTVGARKDLAPDAAFDVDASYRRRNMQTYFLEFFGGWGNPIYKALTTTIGITPRLTLKSEMAGHENSLVAGIDLYRSEYSNDNYDYGDALQNFTDINKTSQGCYIQDEFALLQQLYLVAGYRYEQAKYEFDYNDIAGSDPLDSDISPSENAWHSGLVYRYADRSNAYASVSRSFRFPTTEEYSVLWPSHSINTSLKPQTARHFECGVRHEVSPRAHVNVALFLMDVDNELYYDFSTYSNGNYDRTRHEGIDLSFDAQINERISVFGNYLFMKAYFDNGAYDGNDIPLVPRDKAAVGAKITATRELTFNLIGTYMGKRFFMNDQANALSRLNGYFTLDANVSYVRNDWSLVCAANNILGKEYSEFASCNPTTGRKVYYPSATANFNAKLTRRF